MSISIGTMNVQARSINSLWKKNIRRLLLLLCSACVLGFATDKLYLVLFIFSAIFIIWNGYQLYRLHKWLLVPSSSALPDNIGIWGTIFNTIHQQKIHQDKHIQNLEIIIKKVQASTEAFRDGIIMINNQGELDWWNKAASNLLELNTTQDTGQLVTHYIRSPEFIAYFDSEEYTHPIEITSPINHEKMIEFYITLVNQNDRLIVCKDVTQLKQFEAMRQDFIANASHELRTPLTVIAGYLETFLDHADELPTQWRRALSQMNNQSLRMQNLITDLLLLSKLESKAETQHMQVALLPLLTQITSDAKSFSAGKHSIELVCEDIILKGVEMELSSAFSNVIFNAVKYTPENGNIRIHCLKDEKRLKLIVTASGIGIDSIHFSRLTERFYRVDPSRFSNTGGTGLGLAIVKHILLRHDGHLEIDSEIGKGSTFTCHFPLELVL